MQIEMRHRTRSGKHHDGSTRRLSIVPFLTVLISVAALLGVTVTPSVAAEPCANEQVRSASDINTATGQPYSTQLPDCRAYELVSPPDTGGLGFPFDQKFLLDEIPTFQLTPSGDVFSDSQATPPGTGALPDGANIDVFRSRRTTSGWITHDMLPSTEPFAKDLERVAADGSSVLIETSATLDPADVDNPFGETQTGGDLYVARGDGTPPLFVTHGDRPNTAHFYPFVALLPTFVTPELSAVGFELAAITPLSSSDPGNAQNCYVWTDARNRLAGLTNPPGSGSASNCHYYAVAADGQPIIEDTSGDFWTGRIFMADPATAGVGGGFPRIGGSRQLSGSTEHASFDGISADAQTVYLTTTDKLVPNSDSGADIYAIDLAGTFGLSNENPPEPPAVTCVSCGHNSGGASYVGRSADGSHVFFSTGQGLWSWDEQAKEATRLTEAPDASQLVFSQNGQFAIGLSGGGIYEFSAGETPRLIASGNTYMLRRTRLGGLEERVFGGVSNDGSRVVYDQPESRGPGVIDEWLAGGETAKTVQISPLGSTKQYEVMGTAGGQLEDVFFEGHEPLVAQDENAGSTDIYDARTDGGFPAPTKPANNAQTPNPTVPAAPAYPASLALPRFEIALLPPDTSHAASKPKPLSCNAKARKINNAKKSVHVLKRCVKHGGHKKKASKVVATRSKAASKTGGAK
jgi:hypothetical protein